MAREKNLENGTESRTCKEDSMEEYVVNFLADVDVKIEADSPEQAREKARKMFGEYHDKKFDYAYLSEIKFVTKSDGTEV